METLPSSSSPPPSPSSRHEDEVETEEQEQDQPLLQSCGQISTLTLAKLQNELGNGPMGFAPAQPGGERNINEQIQALNAMERACFDAIKTKWQEKHPNNVFSDEMYLRFCRCSVGGQPFKDKAVVWKTMKKFSKRYLQLTTDSLEHSLRSKTVFPLPSMRTVEGLEVCYMRPSRHCVKTTDTRVVLDILGYTLSTMMEREEPCSKGIVLLANMDGFAMCNYATDYWYQLMSMLQGQKVPVRVAQFLIVNPPKWFKNIWNLTESMLTPDFVQRSEMVLNELDLSKYLVAGFEMYLPDEMESGHALTDKLVDDFVEYRKAVELEQGHQLAFKRRQSLTLTKQEPEASLSSTNNSKPLDAQQSSRRLAASESNIAESSSLVEEESQGSKSGIWNTSFVRSCSRRFLFGKEENDDDEEEELGKSNASINKQPFYGLWNTSFARSCSRRFLFDKEDDDEEEEELGNSSTSINKERQVLRKEGMQQRAASTGKVKRSKSECFHRSLLGMMQRQPSSDNLCATEGNGGTGNAEFALPQLRRRDQPLSSRSFFTGSMDQEARKSPPHSPCRSHSMLGSSTSSLEEANLLFNTMDSPIIKSPKTPQKRLQMSPRQQSDKKMSPHRDYQPKMSKQQPPHGGKMSNDDDKSSAEDQDLAKSPHRSRMSISMLRRQSHSELSCEKRSEEEPRAKLNRSSSRRFGLLRQVSQDIRLPYEKSEETSSTCTKRRGGKKGDDDLVQQQQSSERLVVAVRCRPKTPKRSVGKIK